MRKTIFIIAVCLLSTIQVWAAANIFAFGLTGDTKDDGYHIAYSLNEAATAVEFQVINDEGEIMKSFPLTSLAKGENTAIIDTKEIANGNYRWQIKATAESTAAITKFSDETQPQMQFWGPRGLTIDNNPESPFFGRIYVSDTQGGAVTNRTTTNGIYILDPLHQDVTNQGATAYAGGLTWALSASPYRLCVAPDGKLYMADASSAHSGVYIMDPANPGGDFTTVFGGTRDVTNGIITHEGTTIAGSSTVCWVLGEGAETQLFVFDLGYTDPANEVGKTNLLRYDIGELNEPWTSAPSAVVYNDSKNGSKQANKLGCILPDGRGGWWISQTRGTGMNTPDVPSLIHVNTAGTIDYNSGEYSGIIPASTSGGMAISPDYSQITMGTNSKTVGIFNIFFDEDNVPILSPELSFPVLGGNTQGVALDAAGNVYVVSNTNERLSAWALPKDDNSHITPAAAQYLIAGAEPLPAQKRYVPNDPGDGSTFYTTLTEAFTDINENGISSDLTLYINGDITEANCVGLINPSEYSITIRPDADEDRTIQFNGTVANAGGPSGAISIGVGMSRAWEDLGTAQNITIDGYAEGGETRRLKIASQGASRAMVLANDCSNIQIKNCTILTDGGIYGVYLESNPTYGVSTMPCDILIENNHITAKTSGSGQTIALYASAAPAKMATGVIIRNNYLDARTRGIFLNYTNGIEISGNEFHVKQTNAGTLSSGIMGNTALSGDIVVKGNNFAELMTYNSSAGDVGMKGIIASGGGTWYIDNNFFSDIDMGYANGSCMLQFIRVGSPCVIRHNTFYMKPLTKLPVNNLEEPKAAEASYCAINIVAGEPEIRNNIFISNEDRVFNFIFRGNPGSNCSNNVLYLKAGNEKARLAPGIDSFEAFQTVYSSETTNWVYADVEFEDAAAGNLKLAGKSVQDIQLSVPLIPEVAVDILGATREDPTYAGAHQSTLPFGEVVGFDTPTKESVRVITTPNGIEVNLQEASAIELYSISGQLIEKTTASGTYSRHLSSGMYIIRINGEAVKFVK